MFSLFFSTRNLSAETLAMGLVLEFGHVVKLFLHQNQLQGQQNGSPKAAESAVSLMFRFSPWGSFILHLWLF